MGICIDNAHGGCQTADKPKPGNGKVVLWVSSLQVYEGLTQVDIWLWMSIALPIMPIQSVNKYWSVYLPDCVKLPTLVESVWKCCNKDSEEWMYLQTTGKTDSCPPEFLMSSKVRTRVVSVPRLSVSKVKFLVYWVIPGRLSGWMKYRGSFSCSLRPNCGLTKLICQYDLYWHVVPGLHESIVLSQMTQRTMICGLDLHEVQKVPQKFLWVGKVPDGLDVILYTEQRTVSGRHFTLFRFPDWNPVDVVRDDLSVELTIRQLHPRCSEPVFGWIW